jgi:hypothetical protein
MKEINQKNQKFKMELNKDILQKNLQQLPSYAPEESLWSRIDAALDADSNEIHSETLHRAIHALPTYQAPIMAWDKIENALHIEQDQVLRTAIQQLPTHIAPPQIWKNIAQSLDSPKTSLKIVKTSYLRYAVAAASIGVVLATGLWFLNKSDNVSSVAQIENVTYSQEVAALPTETQKTDIVTHDEAIKKVNTFCEKQAVVCEKPDFQALKSELEELTAAKNELQEAIGEFNTDENLVAQLSSIEEEREEILKKLLNKI